MQWLPSPLLSSWLGDPERFHWHRSLRLDCRRRRLRIDAVRRSVQEKKKKKKTKQKEDKITEFLKDKKIYILFFNGSTSIMVTKNWTPWIGFLLCLPRKFSTRPIPATIAHMSGINNYRLCQDQGIIIAVYWSLTEIGKGKPKIIVNLLGSEKLHVVLSLSLSFSLYNELSKNEHKWYNQWILKVAKAD